MVFTVLDLASVNEQDLRKNLKFLKVLETSIESIYSKRTMRVFDVYSNILKYMYSTRFNGGSARSGASSEAQSLSRPPMLPPLSFASRKHEGDAPNHLVFVHS